MARLVSAAVRPGIGLKPAKQCIFLHLENLPWASAWQSQARASEHVLAWLTLVGLLAETVGLPKAPCLKATWCALPIFQFGLVFFLSFFSLFLEDVSRDTHASL